MDGFKVVTPLRYAERASPATRVGRQPVLSRATTPPFAKAHHPPTRVQTVDANNAKRVAVHSVVSFARPSATLVEGARRRRSRRALVESP